MISSRALQENKPQYRPPDTGRGTVRREYVNGDIEVLPARRNAQDKFLEELEENSVLVDLSPKLSENGWNNGPFAQIRRRAVLFGILIFSKKLPCSMR